ncbi:MAG: UvrB/UvrC motif-containing protein [Spirochaetales bacterium]|nr:UvrB/UvrC motif-containing protein [Spirochaetales bacterium]
MKLDITGLLREWEYDPDNYIRVLKLKDGREVLQVRQPLGIEQYELEGRPDGKKPFEKESVLNEYLDRLEYHILLFSTDENFKLNYEDFILLQDEGMLYYARYLLLYQIADYEKTIKDTEHNLKLCDFIDKYLNDEDVKNELLQYRPYIVKINAISKAMIKMKSQLKMGAREILKEAIDLIQNIPEINTPTFQLEKKRSLDSLRTTLMEMSEGEFSEIDNLENELSQAVEKENYERAAELRDMIDKLKKERTSEQS